MVPHYPWPKQIEFLRLDCREALYGGAAGGGKSDATLMAAAQYVHVPRYAALIVRKTYKDLSLPGAVMDRALEWWRGKWGIHWNPDDRRLTFPSGATITFGYLESEVDKLRYQGAEIQYLGVDEATQFPESRARYLMSRLRRHASFPVPIRARFTANPGGIGHDWVFNGFVKPGAKGRFIPALAKDNPSIDFDEYMMTLDVLDPITKEQLKNGVWIRDGGGLVYGQFNEERNFIGRHEIPDLQYHICALDFGVNDQNAITVLGWRDHDPCIYVRQSYRLRGLVDEVASEVVNLDKTFHFDKIVGDTGGMGKLFQEELRRRYHLPVDPAQKVNKWGYVSLFNAALARGSIKVLREECIDLVDEWLALPKTADGEAEADGFLNHAADSCLYGWRACNAFNPEPRDEKPKDEAERIAAMARELEKRAFEYGDEREEELV